MSELTLFQELKRDLKDSPYHFLAFGLIILLMVSVNIAGQDNQIEYQRKGMELCHQKDSQYYHSHKITKDIYYLKCEELETGNIYTYHYFKEEI